MRGRIILRAGIPGDLQAILAYFNRHSPQTADRFADAVRWTLHELALMPGKGSPKQFSHPKLADLRSWWVKGFRNYLVFYKAIPDGIDVPAIMHGARHLDELLEQRV